MVGVKLLGMTSDEVMVDWQEEQPAFDAANKGDAPTMRFTGR